MAVRRGGYSRWMNTPRIIMEFCLQNDQTILCIMCFALTSWAFESRNLIDGVHDDPRTIQNCWTTVPGIPSKQRPEILITSHLLLQCWCLPTNWLHYQCRIPGWRAQLSRFLFVPLAVPTLTGWAVYKHWLYAITNPTKLDDVSSYEEPWEARPLPNDIRHFPNPLSVDKKAPRGTGCRVNSIKPPRAYDQDRLRYLHGLCCPGVFHRPGELRRWRLLGPHEQDRHLLNSGFSDHTSFYWSHADMG